MKIIGVILIAIGIGLFLFIGYSLIKERDKIMSPVPAERGVKVIFITPQPSL